MRKPTVYQTIILVILMTFVSSLSAFAEGFEYTNLIDGASRAEVRKTMLANDLPKDRIDTVFAWIDAFNLVEKKNVSSGWQPMPDGHVTYDRNTPIVRDFANAYGGHEDVYCRSVAFYLAAGIVDVANPLPPGKMLLTQPFVYEDNGETITAYGGDWNVIHDNPEYTLTEDEQAVYFTVFNPVPIEPGADESVRHAAILNAWNQSGVSFADADYALVTIWNDYSHEDAPYVFAGHAGVLLETDDGLLFFEKTNPLFPYQATRFDSLDQLRQYMIDTMTAENAAYGMETDTLLVLVNDRMI